MRQLLDPSSTFKQGKASASILSLFSLFLLISALLYFVIGVSVVAPKLSEELEPLRQRDLNKVVEATGDQLNLYFEDRLKLVRDLSRVPHIVNAAVLSSGDSEDLADYMSSFNVLEEEPYVAILNIVGEVIYETPDSDVDLKQLNNQWFELINEEKSSFEFRLYPSSSEQLQYLIAVPIRYNGYVEGVLAVSLETRLSKFGGSERSANKVLQLCDGSHCIRTEEELPQDTIRIERSLAISGLRLATDFDAALSSQEYRSVSRSLLFFMWGVGAGAFILFSLLGYKIIVRPYERLKAQRDQLALLRSAMENAVEGVARLDKQGKYDYLNDAYAKLCGFKAEDLLGQPWYLTIAPEERESVEYTLNSMDPNGKVTQESIGVRQNGKRFHQLLTFIPIVGVDEEAYSGHFCFLQDISDRKQAELKLKKANEELESFAYRTSHDLRSPLVSAEGLLSLTERLLDKGNVDQAKMAIEKCTSSVTKLQTIIDDILTLSRSDHLEEEVESVDVHALVDESLAQLSNHANYDVSEFNIDMSHEGHVITVKIRLHQILSNLISNALKYSDPEERAPRISVKSWSADNHLIVAVEDNGIGIPPDGREKLFGMFQRFHSHYAYGSGLGLYLVRKNAEALGGEIRYEAPEQGSRFVLTIPQRMEA